MPSKPGKRGVEDKSVIRDCKIHGREEDRVVKTTFRH